MDMVFVDFYNLFVDFCNRLGKVDNSNWVWIPQLISFFFLVYYIVRIFRESKSENQYNVSSIIYLLASLFFITYFILSYGKIFESLHLALIITPLNMIDSVRIYTIVFNIMFFFVFVAFSTHFSKSLHTITMLDYGKIAGTTLSEIYDNKIVLKKIEKFFRYVIFLCFILIEITMSAEQKDIKLIGLFGVLLYIFILCWFSVLCGGDNNKLLNYKWKTFSFWQFVFGFMVCVCILLWGTDIMKKEMILLSAAFVCLLALGLLICIFANENKKFEKLLKWIILRT